MWIEPNNPFKSPPASSGIVKYTKPGSLTDLTQIEANKYFLFYWIIHYCLWLGRFHKEVTNIWQINEKCTSMPAVCMYAAQASFWSGSAFVNWIPLPHTQRFQPKDKDLEVPHYVVNHRFFNKNSKTFKLHAAQMPQTTEIVRKSHINMCWFPENQFQRKGSHVRLEMIFMFVDIVVACVL